MRRPGPVTLALLLWFFSEYMAFSFVVSKIGFGGALLVGVATSVLGVSVLRRLGSAAIARLRRQFETAQPENADLLDGTLSAIGAILLILPGFISDLIGLGLLSPSVRHWLSDRFGSETFRKKPGSSSPDLIDLDAADWRQIDESGPRKTPRPRSRSKTHSNITSPDAS